ncbi:amidohydrolase [Microbacter sp. GSS18]|nr:amidohydrolase [Microbacter sp. GSS18]
MSDITIWNARPWGGAARDISVRDGRVVEIKPHDVSAARSDVDVDGAGRIIVPSFTDAHVHLDSTRIGLPFRPHSAEPGPIWNQIMNDRANWRSAEASVADRATETLGRAIANGMTRARSYAQVDADCRLERLEGVLAARDEHALRSRVEIVAFPQAGLLLEPGVPALMEAGLRSGADIVGGIDPCALDGDPRQHLDIVFELAERHHARVDIHLHEPGELGLFTARKIIERVRALDYRSRVTIAHAFFLADLPNVARQQVLEDLAELDIALTTVAPAGRSPLPFLEIAEYGIRFGLGQDGQRDYWSPYGNTDMLERTWMLAYTNGMRRDEHIEGALLSATLGGAAVIDSDTPTGPERGFGVGDAADFVLLDAETATSAVMDRPTDRTVIHEGRVVADKGSLR